MPYHRPEKSVLFVAWHMHSNQTGWIRGLHARGYRVTYLVQRISWTEYHEELSPTVIGPSTLCRLPWFRIAYLGDKAVWFRRRRVIPSLRKTWKLLWKTRPAAIVVRQASAATVVVGLLGRLFTSRIVFYIQQPLYSRRQPGATTRLKRSLLSLLFAEVVTPVRGAGPYRFARNACFVPFAVSPMPGAGNREYATEGQASILCLAKLFAERKNHFTLFRALESLAKKHNFHLTLIGALNSEDDPYYQRILTHLESSHIGRRTTIIPNLPYTNVMDHYLSHDIFVLPSEDEPAAVANLEAMAAGMAVICTSANGTCDYLPSPDAALYVAPGDVDSLREAIDSLLSDRRKIAKMGRSAYRMCVERYAPKAVAERLEAVLLGNAGGRRSYPGRL